MNVVGHYHIGINPEPIFQTAALESQNEQIAVFLSLKVSKTAIAGEGDEVSLLGFVVALQTEWHEGKV